MIEIDLETIFDRKWVPAMLAGAAAATILLSTLNGPSPRRKSIRKGLSRAGNPSSNKKLKDAFELHPEHFHGRGEDAHFPEGAVKYWLVGPADGKKVR